MNGLAPVFPAPDALVGFSCPVFPKLINPSLSSEFFLRPQILNATTPSPAKSIAPPIPTTTPMIVFRVFELMPDDDPELPSLLRAAVPVGRVDVTVEEASELYVDPSWVRTIVLTTTKVVGVGVTLAVVFVVVCFPVEVEEVSSASADDDDVLEGVDEADDEGVAESEVVGVVVGMVVGVVEGVTTTEGEDEDGVGVGVGVEVVSSSSVVEVEDEVPLPPPVPVARGPASEVPDACRASISRP